MRAIRVATTTGQWNQWWLDNPDPMSSQVVVLDKRLHDQSIQYVEIGSVVGIAPPKGFGHVDLLKIKHISLL